MQREPPTTYSQRLAIAMGFPDAEPTSEAKKAVAAAIGVSYQAIAKVFRDSSKSMSAENNSRTARHLRVDPDWLATGEGEMQPDQFSEQARAFARWPASAGFFTTKV